MDIPLSSLICYLAAAAYLLGCVVTNWLNAFKHQRFDYSEMHAQITHNRSGGLEVLLNLSGALLGFSLFYWAGHWLVKEWLLGAALVLALWSEGLQITRRETQLLSVLVLLSRLRDHMAVGENLPGALQKTTAELPDGDPSDIGMQSSSDHNPYGALSDAVRQTVQRWRSGGTLTDSLTCLGGLDPLLDEFLLAVRLSGWQNRTAVQISLSRLVERAGRVWDRTLPRLHFKAQIRPLLLPGQAALRAGIGAVLLSNLPALQTLWLSRDLLVLAVCAAAVGGALFAWLRPHGLVRNLLTGLFILSMLATNSVWLASTSAGLIQQQTITFSTDNAQKAGSAAVHTEPIFVLHFQEGSHP